MNHHPDRRTFLTQLSMVIGGMGLAGCGGGGGSSGGSSGAGTDPATPPATGTGPTPQPGAPAASPGLPSFVISSARGGADLPFAFGHVFAQGDIPAGKVALAAGATDWQCSPLTVWPDGSLRHAIVAGRATCTAGVDKRLTLAAGTAPTGTALSEADLAAALPAVTITAGAFSWSLKSSVGTADLRRTVCTGPVMSNFIYRKPVAGSSHLVLWADVRLYKGGQVEVFPWVENGYLLVANASNDVRSYLVTIGGTQVFSNASLDIKHHTRIPLVDGTSWSHWSGTDPQITPRHDTAYLMASRMVPNYAPGAHEAAYAFTERYTPNWPGDTNPAMATAGFSHHIGILPTWSALYLAGGADPRAYRYVVANGLAAGAWPTHHRNEATHEPPTYTEFPDISITWNGTPSVPAGSGGVNQRGGISAAPDTDHQPSLAYLPWLLTGRWFFLDELLLWNFWNYMQLSQDTREHAASLYFNGPTRGRGWSLRTAVQALVATPEAHPSHASLKAAWEANCAAYRGRYVDGTRDGGAWKNNLGCAGLYGGGGTSPYGTDGTHWWDAPWMQAVITMAFGHGWDLSPTLSPTAQADHRIVRDFCYRQVIDRAGSGAAGTWSYRRFSVYQVPYSTPPSTAPGTWLASWGAAYAVYEAHGGGNFSALQPLPSGTAMYYGDAPLGPGDWAESSGTCFNMAALTYAVEHGAPDAAAGWLRITRSASWSGALEAYKDVPVWGLYPRRPPSS